jgi:peptide/nickel transport system permease protein
MRLLLRRSALAVPLLLLVSALVFLLLQAVPGGPLAAYLENPNVRPEDIARLRAAMGLDAPVTVQYARWLTAFVQGDWGYSYADGRPVLQRVLERLPATLELVLAGSALALLLALPLGLIAATRVWGARVSRLVTTMGVSVPVFWLGLLLQLLLAMQLGWLPSSGRQSFGSTSVADRLMHLVLPALVLAAVQGAAWTRYLQRAMRDTLALPFVNAGRVRGLSESRLVWRHALPNALGPFVTVVLLDAAMLASGAVVTESVFAWPGVGSLFTEALVKRDYPVLMAFLMVGAVTVIVLNLLADLAVARLDPRTREAT